MAPVQQPPRILIFDSGVGGLSVLKEIQQRLANCQFFYASDNAAFPYGIKPEAELIARVDHVLHQILAKISVNYGDIDIIVVACNTASTLTLPHIRSHFSQPIVGVVPAIKPAAAQSRSKVIGLLATPATIARAYTHQLIKDYAADCQVISVGSSELVQLAELKLRGEAIPISIISQITAPFREPGIAHQLDKLVLACTHFPLLSDEISRCLPADVQLIDSGEAIARRVESLLVNHPEKYTSKVKLENLALFTKAAVEVELLRPALAQFSLSKLEVLAI